MKTQKKDIDVYFSKLPQFLDSILNLFSEQLQKIK